jgi:serine/threonine-protein kinase
MLGKTVSHYEVLEQLGGGGMGVVYKARDTRLGRSVALKFLSAQLGASPAHKERFLREARAASALDHPHICSIYDLGETEDGGLFIAMAFCPGETLKERIARGPLPFEEALLIALQIAEGLASAHSHGIVHRDIKPGNVMVGEDGTVKLVDFGLAKLAGDSDLTRTGTVVGTAAYMSPEQVMGDPIDHRTDLWSLGVLLYEMVTGKRPFRGERDQAVMHAIVTRDFSADALPPDEAPALSSLLARLLAKNPDDRYASAAEVAAELRLLLGLPPASGTARTLMLSSPGRPADDPTRLSRPLASRPPQVTGAASFARTAAESLPALRPGPVWLPAGRTRQALLAAAALAAVLLGAWAARRALAPAENPATPLLPEQMVLAVLPFKDLSGRPGGQLVGDGLAETVSARLASAAGVQVVPPSAAAGAVPADPRSAARVLGANLVLHGSVQRSRDEVRITYSVLNAERGRQVAGDSLTGPDEELFAIQDRLAESVLRSLAVTPSRPVAAAAPAGLATAEQQTRYLRAMGLLRRYDRAESVAEAMVLLEALAVEAPQSAAVQAALGRAYLHQHNLTREPRWVDLAVAACARARRLDPADSEVDVTLGTLRVRTGEPKEAIAAFRHALARQPEHFEALLGLASAYVAAGQPAVAETTYKQAIALRPSYWGGYSKLGGLYYNQGRYQSAAAMFRRATELAPDNARAFSNLGGAYQLMGDLPRALAALKRSVELAPTAPAYSNLGTAEFFLGHTREAATAFEHAVELTPGDFRLWAYLGDAYRWTPGMAGKARAAYERAIELAQAELRINPHDGLVHSVLALCLAKTGRSAQAERHAHEALAASPEDPELLYSAASVAAVGRRPAQALALLARAAQAGYNRAFIAHDPELAALRREDSFQRIVRGYNQGSF